MAEEGEFKIKGAAQKHQTPEKTKVMSQESPEQKNTALSPAEARQAGDRQDQDAESGEDREEENDASDEDETAQYRWFKCRIDNPEAYNGQCFYWLHADTKQSSWEEPNEPFWIWDAAAGKADPIGLQFPRQAERTREEVLQLDPVAKWGGYDPRIHGDYDPNADYAKYHEARRHEEAAALNLSDTTFAPVPYQASMGFNRVSGSAQASGVGPERHSDAAKSGRQMNAYFDVDAAANAHDGRSLKAERQKQRFSREQVQAFRVARKEKQRRRHMGWLTS